NRDQAVRPCIHASAAKMSGGDCLNYSRIKELIPPGAHWLMLAITAVFFLLVMVFVDLKPVVEENFFFSTGDPGFAQSRQIERRFPSQPQLVLAVSSTDISSPRYIERIGKLTGRTQAVDAATGVKSSTAGPRRCRE